MKNAKTLCSLLAMVMFVLIIGIVGSHELGNIDFFSCAAAIVCLGVVALVLQYVAETMTEEQKSAKKEPPVLGTQNGSKAKKITNNTIIAQKLHEINTKNTF